ncbi:Imm10 family immunity protein [Arsenicibacter rosenii]|uniref:Uncharacterized protein n=1 Tax=Arsenicibacter rosenii TaxID=1750698 RepID=A0A1S2VI71_9BACT|nr:Imm10 family immunity protein [Arsenicibacter rosenii]OIN58451.1 hypothetical protein BLX24_15800 [Arsenicibacter rosenii]
MKVQFQANTVVVQEEDEVAIVAFADDAIQPTEVFMLQCALFEEPDQPVYCERNGQSQGCYDGIQRAELRRTGFRIELNKEGVARLGCDWIEVGFEVDESNFSRLHATLHLMFNHSGVLMDKL